MSSTSVSDVSCGVFGRLQPGDLATEAIHRFVVGEDQSPRVLDVQEAAETLGDSFATLLLLRGVFPRTAGQVLEALAAAAPDGDPLTQPTFFFLGEGSQIPFTAETAALNRKLRFLASTAPGPEGPDVLLSSFHPGEGDVEVMAWDHTHGGFNYYRTVGGSSAWVFAGNSRHALLEATEFKGPFESHPSGNFLMKELRAPWVHWHSPDAPVPPDVFDTDDPLANHPWFRDRDRLGAFACETKVARPSIERWTKARFAALVTAGVVDRPARIMQQILETPTVNLITSHVESRVAPDQETVDLPQTFFVDSESLTEVLGLAAPPPLNVPGTVYGASLGRLGFRLTDDNGFSRPGDTHFAFIVPERAFEDTAVLREAIDVGLLTPRLAACLLMVDFPNPIFSTRRPALLRHVPQSATLTGGASVFSQDIADAILAAAETTAEDSPEREFAMLWEAGEDWPTAFGELLKAYYDAVVARLSTQDDFDDYCRLADSRRDRVRDMPIAESPLLFPRTDIPRAAREMRADGTVVEVAS